MRVLYFAKGDETYPSSRYRAWQFVEPLAQLGVSMEVRPLFDNRWMEQVMAPRGLARKVARLGLGAEAVLRRWRGFEDLPDFDLVVIEQELAPILPFALEQHLLSGARRIAVELDDAHYLKPGRASKFEQWFGRADAVICGNDYLAKAVTTAGGRAFTVPTVVDIDLYTQRRHQASDRLRLVWLGLPSNLPHLRGAAEALRQLSQQRQCELVVVSSSAPEIPGLRVVHEPWSQATEASVIGNCDVGLMPLPDEEWTRGKCGLKLLQYLAAGLPAVASPVGVNCRIAEGGGVILAQDVDAWVGALLKLRDAPARERLGREGRQSVAASWSLQVWAKKLAAIYGELGAGRA